MAGKPDLSAATGIQNVIVYVSDDNFAQAYSLGQQNVQETNHIIQGEGYDVLSNPNTSMVGQPKAFREKPAIKLVDYALKQQQVDNVQQREYYNNAIPQNRQGYTYPPLPQPEFTQNVVNDVTFHNGNCENVEVLQQEEKQLPGTICNNVRVREDCTSCETYVEQNYTKVMGTDIPIQGVCYDTVRLEAADSSCSSLSSSDDGSQVLPNQASEMVVYDPNVNLQAGNVVLTVGSPLQQQQQQLQQLQQLQQHQLQQQTNNQLIENFGTVQRPTITVPYGWKRLLNNGSIIYISPSCTALRSPDQIKEYLLTAGTCKCGLECHFKHESVFNFDPKVIGKPYVLLPDSKSGNMTKLCNHKRKIMPLISIDGPPIDPNIKFQRELSMKRKKRRIGLPYIDGVPVSQIMTHRDKIALNQNADKVAAPQQVFSEYPANIQQQNHLVKYQDQQGNRVILSDGTVMVQQSNVNNDTPSPEIIKNDSPVHQMNTVPNVFNTQPRQVLGPNGQILHVRGPTNNQGNVYHMPHPPGPRMITHMPKVDQPEEHRIFISRQPTEPTGPGRPQHIQIVRVNAPNQQKVVENHQLVDRNQPKRHMQPLQPQFCNPQQYQQVQLCGPHRHIRPYNQANPGFRPHRMLYQPNQMVQAPPMQPNQQKVNWPNQVLRRPNTIEQQKHLEHQQKQLEQQQKQLEQQQKQLEQQHQNQAGICERVPPLYQHTPPVAVCQEEMKRKKVKMGKFGKNRPYRLVEGACSNNHFSCPNIDIRHIPQENRPVMMNNFSQNIKSSSPSFMEDPSGYLAQQTALLNSTINRQTGAAGCAGFTCNSPGTLCQNHLQQNLNNSPANSPSQQELPPPNNIMTNEPVNNLLKTSRNNFSRIQQETCKPLQVQPNFDNNKSHQYSAHCRCCVTEGFQGNYPIKTGRPSISNVPGTLDDPVTSSTSFEKQFNQTKVDIQPIQGGTVSTSNISPMENNSDPPTPERMVDNSQISSTGLYIAYTQADHVHEYVGHNRPPAAVCKVNDNVCCFHSQASTLVTTMASSRTVGSNTITSVLAGRSNTTTTSLNTPSSITGSFISRATGQNTSTVQSQPITKSPLEMVQSIVSSIQIPNISQPSQIVKDGIQQEQHILVSSGEQMVMGGSQEEMHIPPKIITNEGMPPVTVSPMVTNVTSSVGTVIPAVGQQVLGQQTVLVNALPAPFVLQPGISMTMEGVPVGQNLQLPQFVTGNLIQQQIQIDNAEGRRIPPLLSPDTKKKGKKRKEPAQTVASMLQFATQQNPSVVISPQGFPQQIQMNSPQSVTATPVMQAVTIVPNKTGAPAQIIMSDPSMTNSNLGTQQLITNSQSQQINLLQPVNLINGTGMVQNFPAIHQFIVPNLGGMVMNPDGTATILQDTSNLGMQLQFQNVNGQNMLTSVQNNTLFNNGQTIFATGPSGMVIRTPTSQGKIIQQQHSPVAQFLSPNGGQFIMNGSQFSGQLSPLVASVSPNQQVTFNSPPQQIRSNNPMQPPQQEYIHMNGQTLIVPCTLGSTIPVSNQTSNQNTTFLQQNTTIVQQQTTMLTNQGLQNFQNNQQVGNKPATLTSGIEESRESPKSSSSHCRQSVSTQTAVNQNVQAIITNTSCQTSTISASSPPDTTTMSPVPVASEMQSPILADTTTHNDDGLSPVPLSCSTGRNDNIRSESQSCTMAMVHCISSSEPDPSDMQHPDHDWKQSLQASSSNINGTYAGMTHIGKMSSPTQLVSAESSSIVTSLHYGASDQETISSSKHFDRKKTAADCCVVMETHQQHVSLFGGGVDVLNENEVDEEIEDNGEDGNGQGSEGDEDDDPNEGYLVGSLLINS